MTERFALLSRDKAAAIVAYLQDKAGRDQFARTKINQALAKNWQPRAGD